MTEIFCCPRDISYYPLPRTNSGSKYIRQSGNVTVSYVSPHTLPFGKWGDISAMLISTKAKMLCEGERDIEFESLYKELQKFGFDRSSGYQERRFFNALEAWTTVMVTVETVENLKKSIENIPISIEAELYYGENKRDGKTLLPKKSFITLAEPGFRFFTEKAIPVKAEDIIRLQSVMDIRAYVWLVRKLYSIKHTPVLISWDILYQQFGPVPRQLKPRFRERFKNTLTYIQNQLYPGSHFFTDDEKGIVFIPSDPHIKPKSGEGILVPSFDAWSRSYLMEAK